MFVDEPMILREDCIEVACNDPTPTSGLTQEGASASICRAHWKCKLRESRCMLRRWYIAPDTAGVAIFMQSVSLAYLLGSSMWKTLSSISFPPPSPSLLSNGEPKHLLDREQCHGLVRCVVLSIGCQEPEHTLGSSRGNWMSLECVMGHVWIFQDMRHRLCLLMVSAG